MFVLDLQKRTFTNTVLVLGKYNIWIINVEVMLRPFSGRVRRKVPWVYRTRTYTIVKSY